MQNASELKGILETILKDHIGTYTTPQGRVYSAIRVSPPLVPANWEIQGLEITVAEYPDSPGTKPLSGFSLKPQWWNVRLVQFDINKGLKEATDIIEGAFSNTKVVIVNKPQTRETLGEALVSIYDPTFIGAMPC